VTLYHENNARNGCLTAEEEARPMDALPERLRPFVTVALHTGMRRGELLALRWQDVDFATGTIRVRQDKAGDGRWVVLNSVAREALLAVKREQKVLGPHVFCSPEGKFLHNWEREWRPALQTAKIGDFRFHDCRQHVRLAARDGQGRPLHGAAGGRLEDGGGGAALRAP
jgi:integrase